MQDSPDDLQHRSDESARCMQHQILIVTDTPEKEAA
jgi:hypothetical protein